MNILNLTGAFVDMGVTATPTFNLGYTASSGSLAVFIEVGDPAETVTSVAGCVLADRIDLNNLGFELWIGNSIAGSPTSLAITLSASTFSLASSFNFDTAIQLLQRTGPTFQNTSNPSGSITAAANSAVIMAIISNFQRTFSAPLPAGFSLSDAVGSVFDNFVYDADVGAGGVLTPNATMSSGNGLELATYELSQLSAGGIYLPWTRA